MNLDFDSQQLLLLPSNFSDGFVITPIQIPYPTMEEMGYTRTCVFGISASWEREDGTVVAQNCLQSEPSWMWDHRLKFLSS